MQEYNYTSDRYMHCIIDADVPGRASFQRRGDGAVRVLNANVK